MGLKSLGFSINSDSSYSIGVIDHSINLALISNEQEGWIESKLTMINRNNQTSKELTEIGIIRGLPA